MAAFFHENSQSQTASSDHHDMQQQNLCFMERASLPYSSTPQTTRFFDSSAFSVHTLSHQPQADHHHAGHFLVGLPLPATAAAVTANVAPTNSINTHQNYNLWVGLPADPNPTHNIPDPGSEPSGDQGFDLLRKEHAHTPVTVVSPGIGKRLSLSLSSQQQQPVPYSSSNNSDHIEDNIQGNFPVSIVSNSAVLGVMQRGGGVFGSKYLKATQELLDEIVSMGNAVGIGKNSIERSKEKLMMKKELVTDRSTENSIGKKPAGDLTTAQKQELQMKKTKLVTMIEEVEQRYRQYQHQMQFIISSFEQAAGYGAAKTYTSLALQTISKQFRCLKDAISSEIKSISKTLGEDDCIGAKGESSRLRFADHQLRRLGMIHHHHNAWRPQRGLPEGAVSILRAWLFEHFLHPYPRDSDKLLLAKQTGLTRSQVSNWFINARVRLWKPMVEEMYLEEMKAQEGNACNPDETQNSNNELNKDQFEGSKSINAVHESNNTSRGTDSKPEKSNIFNNNASPTDQCSSSILSTTCLTGGGGGGSSFHQETGFNIIEMDQRVKTSQGVIPKKLRSNEINIGMPNSSSSMVSFDLDMKQHGKTKRQASLSNYVGGFGHYHPMGEIGRFYGNGVSLSLGLPRCDNNINLSVSENQHNFLSSENFGNIQFGTNQIELSEFSTTTGTYQNIDVHNKKRYAPTSLLPDFLA